MSEQIRLLDVSGAVEHGAEPARRDSRDLSAQLAVERTRRWLLAQQHDDGHFVAELEGDSILQSEYVLLLAYLGQHESPLARRLARRLIRTQRPDGGWAMYPGGDVEISGSVKAYFALKLTGHDASAPFMRRARAAILAAGGADAVNSFTRFYLALLGQIDYAHCPAVPPEIVLLPKWSPANLYAISAWSRTIVVPLSIMWAKRPVKRLDAKLGIRELFLKKPEDWPRLRCPGLPGGTGLFSWDRFFRMADAGLKWLEARRLVPLRRRALLEAERWIQDRFEGSDGLGAIFPPMVWSVIALDSLGYGRESEPMRYCLTELEKLVIDDGETARVEPCKSPVWDTSIALRSLLASGASPARPELARASEWLLDRQVFRTGDWAKSVEGECGGWSFEFANEHYPDLDDTSMVAMALAEQFDEQAESDDAARDLRLVSDRVAPLEESNREELLARATSAIASSEQWMCAMQNRDGGWGAFDKDNDREFLCYVPFADHNAMIDPSTPDLTARVLECLGTLGRRPGDPVVDRAVRYLRETQEADGSWFGRWGVNYIYGTWQVLSGLERVGIGPHDEAVSAGADWLEAYQQPCGGWGETARSYDDPSLRGQGRATASQTAWAILGLLAAGRGDSASVRRGIDYLLSTQNPDGTWTEREFTGTGFPRVFYLRYHYYPIYFPLLAMSKWQLKVGRRGWLRLRTDDEADRRG